MNATIAGNAILRLERTITRGGGVSAVAFVIERGSGDGSAGVNALQLFRALRCYRWA